MLFRIISDPTNESVLVRYGPFSTALHPSPPPFPFSFPAFPPSRLLICEYMEPGDIISDLLYHKALRNLDGQRLLDLVWLLRFDDLRMAMQAARKSLCLVTAGFACRHSLPGRMNPNEKVLIEAAVQQEF